MREISLRKRRKARRWRIGRKPSRGTSMRAGMAAFLKRASKPAKRYSLAGLHSFYKILQLRQAVRARNPHCSYGDTANSRRTAGILFSRRWNALWKKRENFTKKEKFVDKPAKDELEWRTVTYWMLAVNLAWKRMRGSANLCRFPNPLSDCVTEGSWPYMTQP